MWGGTPTLITPTRWDITATTMVLIVICVTLWLFNIAKENGPFIDNVHIKTSIYNRLSIAMLNS